MGNPPRGRRKSRRRNPQPVYRLADGDVVTAPQLRRMFMGKIPSPTQRRLLGITKAKATKKNPLGGSKLYASRRRIRSKNLNAYWRVKRVTARKSGGRPSDPLPALPWNYSPAHKVWRKGLHLKLKALGSDRYHHSRRRYPLNKGQGKHHPQRQNPLRPSRNGVLGSRNLALNLLDWHGGQGSPCYLVGSRWHSGLSVSRENITACKHELGQVRTREWSAGRKKGAAEIDRLLDALDRVLERKNPRRRARKTRR